MSKKSQPLSVLHLMLSVGETSAAYNEHCLPLADRRQITICTFFGDQLQPPDNICLITGNGTVRGYLAALRTAFRSSSYDIVHSHSPHVGVIFLLATLLRSSLRRKSVATIHNSYHNFKPRNRLLLIPIFAMFRRVVCCGEASRASFPRFFRFLAGRRLTAAQNGMDIARAERAAENAAPAEAVRTTIVSVGRLIPIKNPITLLQAFADGCDEQARLAFIGQGNLSEQLEQEIRTNRLQDRVQMLGLLPRNQVYQELADADMFVSTSLGEGLPVAVLEAMACGRPVILSDIPPHREIAEGCDDIPLVPPNDVAGFAREMRRMRALSSEKKAEIGKACREIVRSRFSLEAMHRVYPRIYAEVHGKRFAAEEEIASAHLPSPAVRPAKIGHPQLAAGN